MTSDQLIERALRRIVPAPPLDARASLRTALLVFINDALRLLPIKVKERLGDDESSIYQKNYTVTLTAGAGDLSTHVYLTTEPMIVSGIDWVTHPSVVSATNSDGRLRRLGSSSALDLSRSQEYAYFAIEGLSLFTMMNNDRTTLNGDAIVWAAFPPSLSSVKFSHELTLVDCLLELGQVKV